MDCKYMLPELNGKIWCKKHFTNQDHCDCPGSTKTGLCKGGKSYVQQIRQTLRNNRMDTRWDTSPYRHLCSREVRLPSAISREELPMEQHEAYIQAREFIDLFIEKTKNPRKDEPFTKEEYYQAIDMVASFLIKHNINLKEE